MYVAFRPLGVKPTFRNQAVRFYSGSLITHVELLLLSPYPMAIASRAGTGVSPQPVQQAMGDGSGWLFYEIPGIDDLAVYDFLSGQFGADYNYAGILATMLLHVPVTIPNQWFCSELCYVVLSQYAQLGLPIINPARVSPIDLLNMLEEKGIQPTLYPPFTSL